MWIPRLLEPRLRRLAATRPVVVLTSARQTGKTALVRHLFPEHNYVTLDLPSEAAQAESDPQAFLGRHPMPLIVDEVQVAPALFRHLKVVVAAAGRLSGAVCVPGDRSGRFPPLLRGHLSGEGSAQPAAGEQPA